MRKIFFLLISGFIFVLKVYAETSAATVPAAILSLQYYQPSFGHARLQPRFFSSSAGSLACGQTLKVMEEQNINDVTWLKVEVAGLIGYVPKQEVMGIMPHCVQKMYPQFFSSLSLDLTDNFYWGRLQEHYAR